MTAPAGPVHAVADAVRSGRCSAYDAVVEALSRIDRQDPRLGAVVGRRDDSALAEAAVLDRAVADGSLAPGPLAGVPFLVKDLEDVTGMPTRHGSLALRDAPPATSDDPVVARLREAGAIVVGKSALPELATEGFTASLLEGVTRNPWAPAWSPGGSSGGSAVALASGMVPLATATDGGGSVRIPASMCGLLGLKPTLGVVPRSVPPDWLDLSTSGPLATSTDDLGLLLGVLGRPAPGDPYAWHAAPLASTGPPPEVLLAAERTDDFGALPDEVAALLRQGVDALADVLSLPVRWLSPSDVVSGGSADRDWFVLAPAEHVASLGRSWVESHLDELHPATQAFLRVGLSLDIDCYLAARRRRPSYVRQLDVLLERALLVTPTVASSGWLADGRLPGHDTVGMLPADVFATALQNMTGHPAVSLPAGAGANGVRFGLQVTAARGRDLLLVDVSGRWEGAHPWPRAAAGYEPFTLR